MSRSLSDDDSDATDINSILDPLRHLPIFRTGGSRSRTTHTRRVRYLAVSVATIMLLAGAGYAVVIHESATSTRFSIAYGPRSGMDGVRPVATHARSLLTRSNRGCSLPTRRDRHYMSTARHSLAGRSSAWESDATAAASGSGVWAELVT